jgi:hypothetical protein
MQTYSLYYRGAFLMSVKMPAGFQSDDKVRCEAISAYDRLSIFTFQRNALVFSKVQKN